MTEKNLVINQDGGSTDYLWQLIDNGWSVTAAAYHFNKRQFIITLAEVRWPAITLECSICGAEELPIELYFTPRDSMRYCANCVPHTEHALP